MSSLKFGHNGRWLTVPRNDRKYLCLPVDPNDTTWANQNWKIPAKGSGLGKRRKRSRFKTLQLPQVHNAQKIRHSHSYDEGGDRSPTKIQWVSVPAEDVPADHPFKISEDGDTLVNNACVSTKKMFQQVNAIIDDCLLYTSPSPRD